jgi:KipI family sensor histidine kinase inhibitor
VLVKLAGPRYQAPTRQRLGKLRVTAEAVSEVTAPTDGRADMEIDIQIDVVYDGADLDEVARLTGLTTEQVVAAHTATPWRVGFGGFAPGFAYLIGGDGRLEVPRQSEPRTRVPAGSVALAGEFSAVYPRESPGGWQLIGHTSKDTAELWDVDRDPPALLRPGMWVQFRDVR